MQLGIFLLAAVGLLQTAEAFKCRWGQYGECYYHQGTSKETSRCAITCKISGFKSKCNCPANYPSKASWTLIEDQHKCIYLHQYENRNKCQDPAESKRSDDEPRNQGREVTGFHDDDLPRLEEREYMAARDGRDLPWPA